MGRHSAGHDADATVTDRYTRSGNTSPVRLHREDKVTLNLRLDVLATDLLADRDWAYEMACARAMRMVRDQLDLMEVR